MDQQGSPSLDLPRYLSALPLFHDVEQQELTRIAEGCTVRRLTRGQPVFRVGDPCEEFHITVVGQIKLYALSQDGQEKVIEIIGPGGSFAEAHLFTGRPYAINAQTVTDSLMLGVSKNAVLAMIERNPSFSLRMLTLVSRRIHGLERDVEDYTLCTGAQRVIGYLLRDVTDDEKRRGPITVSLPVSKCTIASRLSLTPEYFSRVLRELAADGLIEIQRRNIRILDAQRLFQPGRYRW
jgi:CRP/FNR family transcriptional regulator, dissimilatory nitrate respiration regulator